MSARSIYRGDLYWVHPSDPQYGTISHPQVVIQETALNQSRVDRIVVCSLSTNMKKAREPGNILLLPGEGGLEKRSIIVVSLVASVPRSDLGDYIGHLESSRVDQVLAGLEFQQAMMRGRPEEW